MARCGAKLVEVERPFFPQPPALAGGFLGYDEPVAKLTVCGNCHIDPQDEWEDSDHADAWATLQATGSPQEFCEGCHSVGPNGNPTSGAVGYAATDDQFAIAVRDRGAGRSIDKADASRRALRGSLEVRRQRRGQGRDPRTGSLSE